MVTHGNLNTCAKANFERDPSPDTNLAALPWRPGISKEILAAFSECTRLDVGLNNLAVRARLDHHASARRYNTS